MCSMGRQPLRIMVSSVDPSDIVECSSSVIVPFRDLVPVSHAVVHELHALRAIGFEQLTLRALLLLAGQTYADRHPKQYHDPKSM